MYPDIWQALLTALTYFISWSNILYSVLGSGQELTQKWVDNFTSAIKNFYGHAHKLVCLSYFYIFSCRFRSSCTVDLRQSSVEVVWGRRRAWSWGRRWAWHISCSPWESTTVLPGATRGRRGRGRRERKSVRTSSSSSGNLFQRFVHVYSFIVYKHTYMYQAIQLTVGSLCTSVNYILNSSWACFSRQ